MFHTKELLTSVLGLTESRANEVAPALEQVADEWGMTSIEEYGGWLTQMAAESASFSMPVENMKYSAGRLLEVFGKYYTRTLAEKHEYDERAIANHVYNGRMGNRNSTQDGYNFRGAGYLQNTGRNQRLELASEWGVTPEEATRRLHEEPYWAAWAAAWYWQRNGIRRYASKSNVTAMSKMVNCGSLKCSRPNGLAERKRLYQKIMRFLRSVNEKPKPLIESRTIAGTATAGLSGVTFIVTEAINTSNQIKQIGSNAADAAQSASSLASAFGPYGELASSLLAAIFVAGLAIAIYARIDDRRKGRN